MKERAILIELENNIEENIGILEQAIENLERQNLSSEIVLDFLDDSIAYSDTLSLHFLIATFPGMNTILGLSDAGYEAFKNTGFDILTNQLLSREVISVFETELQRLLGNFAVQSERANIENYINIHFRDTGSGLTPLNRQFLLKDNYYHSITRRIYNIRNFYIRRANEFLQVNLELQDMIRNELGP